MSRRSWLLALLLLGLAGCPVDDVVARSRCDASCPDAP
jgi:hypothetical protein